MESESDKENSDPEDSLKILYFMTFGVMRLRFVKFFLVLILLFHGVIGVFQVVDLLTTFNGNQLLQYGPFFLISCSCLVNISTVLNTEKLLSKVFIKHAMSRFRSTKRFPRKIANRIAKESNWVTTATVGAMSVLFLFSVSHVQVFDDTDMLHGIVLIKRDFGRMASFFCLIFFGTMPVLAYVAFINGGIIIYTLMHLRFYLFIINNNLENLSVNCDTVVDDYLKLTDSDYQRRVFEKLKNCIERHQSVKKLIEKKLNETLLPSLVLFLYLIVAAVVSMLFNILMDRSKFGILLASSSLTVTALIPLMVLHIGQILKNEYDKMYDETLNFPWIIWEPKNRKILLYFMASLQQSYHLGKKGVVLCQYSFIPTVLNFLWTVSTFIVQVGYRNSPMP